MGNFFVKEITYDKKIYYAICSCEDFTMLVEPTKYLKHKSAEHCSPNTVKKIAYSLAYYMEYLQDSNITVDQVLLLKYAEQYQHFLNFLYWLKEGSHTKREKLPNHNTCNAYLQMVFSFYIFLLLEYEKNGNIKILENRELSFNSAQGIRFRRQIMTFRGYLPKEERNVIVADRDSIKKMIKACSNLRNQLLLLLLAETGFRIGEILGIKYNQDIDFEKHKIKVRFREDNENFARAKNAEIRNAKISDETFEILQVYLAENRELLRKSEYLFVVLKGKTQGKPLTVNAVESIFGDLKKKTGLEITPHSLRRFYANERRKQGWSILDISKGLGHKNIATTEKYLHVEEEELDEAMDQYFALNKGLYNVSQLI